jgi:hypothetical protein
MPAFWSAAALVGNLHTWARQAVRAGLVGATGPLSCAQHSPAVAAQGPPASSKQQAASSKQQACTHPRSTGSTATSCSTATSTTRSGALHQPHARPAAHLDLHPAALELLWLQLQRAAAQRHHVRVPPGEHGDGADYVCHLVRLPPRHQHLPAAVVARRQSQPLLRLRRRTRVRRVPVRAGPQRACGTRAGPVRDGRRSGPNSSTPAAEPH